MARNCRRTATRTSGFHG